MPSFCNPALNNLGSGDCKLEISQIRRLVWTLKRKEDNTLNVITLSNAVTLANWQTLMNKYNFSSDVKEKIVPTVKIYNADTNQDTPKEFDEDDYYKELGSGGYDLLFDFFEVLPDYIAMQKTMKDNVLSFYMIDASGRIWGESDGTNLIPLEVANLKVPDFQLQSKEDVSREAIMIRLKDPSRMNAIASVELTDGDPNDITDFYSLIDGTNTTNTPAVTGIIMVLASRRNPDDPIVGITYDEIIFYETTDPTTAIPLASAGSITEDPNGEILVNEAALLTTLKLYDIKISHEGYDIEVARITIP